MSQIDEIKEVHYELRGHAAWITIARAKNRNTLNGRAINQLLAALRRAAADETARLLVLTGEGDQSFCAGGDMRDMASSITASDHNSDDGSHAGSDSEARLQFSKLLGTLCAYPKPMLARINGDALGGGLGLMLACDLAVAADHARFGTPEINIGLFPWMILPLIEAHIGPKKLADLVLSGRRFGADEALALELVNEVVPAAELDKACDARIKMLEDACPTVLRQAMVNLRNIRYRELPATLAKQEDHFFWNLQQPEVLEGVGAFLEHRKPSWKIER